MRWISEKLIKGKIKNQLYMVYWIAIFIPVFAIGSYLILNTRSLLYKQDYASLESDNLRVRSIMLDTTNQIYTVGNSLFADEELQKVLGAKYESSQAAYDAYRLYHSKKVDNIKNTQIAISRIEFYIETITEYGSFKAVTDKIANENWYKRALSTPQPIWVSMNYNNSVGNTDCELRFVQRIPIIKTGKYAVLVIGVNNNHLKSRINNNVLNNDVVVNQDIIFYSETGKKTTYLDAGIDYDESYYHYSGKRYYGDKNVLMQISTLKPAFSSDYIYVVTSDYTAIPYIEKITLICIAIICFSMIVPFIMVSLFTRTFSTRILTLRHVMHKVALGDYGITESLKGNDELTDVFMDLQKMIKSINKMDEEIYSAKIKEEQLNSHQQRIKYEMLASQINPHFLYNTLETIRMKALNVENNEVANAIKLLGKSMRHVLDNSLKTVSLESELEYIKVYLQIQHIRFGDRIRYVINVAEEIDCKRYYILPLLLQPIVENAVSHGLEARTGVGDLEIRIFYEGDKLIISVEDNGMGMTEEELELLVTRMKKEQLSTGESIGLHNIYQRIQLFYGEKYGVEITSCMNEGTKVSISLPKYAEKSVNLNETLYNRTR